MRQKAFDPLSAVAIAATLVAVLCLLLVSPAARAPTLLWTDKDFANYWIASRLALDGRGLDVFGPQDAYLAHLRAVFGADYPWRNWSYPPHYLLLILPLSLLSYKAALILFLLITFLLLCAAIRLVCRRPAPWQILLLLPAIATNGLPVQNGYILSALLLAGLTLRDKRPVLAGICFGLLTIKPQLGVLLPFLLLRERQWRTVASACATTVVLGLLSLALFGADAWSGYVANVVPYQAHVMREIEGLFPI